MTPQLAKWIIGLLLGCIASTLTVGFGAIWHSSAAWQKNADQVEQLAKSAEADKKALADKVAADKILTDKLLDSHTATIGKLVDGQVAMDKSLALTQQTVSHIDEWTRRQSEKEQMRGVIDPAPAQTPPRPPQKAN